MSKPLALIIEDDRVIANIASISLQNEFETESIADGHAALIRLTQVIPTLILLDLHLPTISGIDILGQIHADARLKGTKIILCTAGRIA